MSDPSPEPAEATLLKLIGGYRVTQALYVITTLGIPDRLSERPKDASTLASEMGAHPDRLFRLLRALVPLGVLKMDDEKRFSLTSISQLLRSDSAQSFAVVATFAGEEPYRAWGELRHCVTTGETAFDHLYEMGYFEYLDRHPGAAETFHQLMARSSGAEGFPLEGYALGRHRIVVDIGGGKGALLAAALGAHRDLRGILFDLPAAVVDAPKTLSAAGVAERCEIRTGTAFDSVPPGGDLYILSRVLHDWPDDQAAVILSNCRRVMEPGNVLLVVDGVLRPGSDPSPRLWLDLVMMVMNGGRERTGSEWSTLLERAGFAVDSIRPSGPNQDLIAAHAV